MTNIDVEDRFSETPVQPVEDEIVTVGLHGQFEFPAEGEGHDPYENCSTWARIMCGRVARSAAPVLTAQEMEANRLNGVREGFEKKWDLQLD